MVVNKQDITNFLNNISLRKIKTNGIYFEQKITPDVLSFTAKCIIYLINNDTSKSFSDKDIRELDFFREVTTTYFSKPEQTEETEGEYNKFTSYHLGLLAFSKILKEVDQRPKRFKIENLELLNFISQNDTNSLMFLEIYLDKLLRDNKLYGDFHRYIITPNQDTYKSIKENFWHWARENTNVRGSKPTHTYRVFNKIFNLFAYSNSLPGESASIIREGRCPYVYLVYNRINFRDVNRPRGISRIEYSSQVERNAADIGWIGFLTNAAKSKIKEKYLHSEVLDKDYSPEINGKIQIHHIFPQAEFLEFSSYLENLIALTAGQHNSHAHDKGTRSINKRFQVVCLLAKLKDIESSLSNGEELYELDKFIFLINKGLDLNISDDSNINSIRDVLNSLKENAE